MKYLMDRGNQWDERPVFVERLRKTQTDILVTLRNGEASGTTVVKGLFGSNPRMDGPTRLDGEGNCRLRSKAPTWKQTLLLVPHPDEANPWEDIYRKWQGAVSAAP